MKKYICLHVMCMCSILFTSTQIHAYKYGLGSCLDQSLDQVIWRAIQEENLDGFIFLETMFMEINQMESFLK